MKRDNRKKREKRELKQAFRQALDQELREHKSSFIVYNVLRVLVFVALARQIMLRNYEGVFFCGLTILLFYIPSWLQIRLRIELPPALEITILCFIFAAEILGEVNAFYVRVPNWDTMLHTLNGFLCAAIGFCLVDMFDRSERFSLSLSPAFLAIVSFCFSMTIGVLWEFFECFMDQCFLLDMQKDVVLNQFSSVLLDPTGGNHPVIIQGITDVILVTGDTQIPLGIGGYLDVGLLDTMKDLAVNFVGAVVFSVIGYFYVKGRGKGWFARRFIPQVLEELAGTVDLSPEDPENEKKGE